MHKGLPERKEKKKKQVWELSEKAEEAICAMGKKVGENARAAVERAGARWDLLRGREGVYPHSKQRSLGGWQKEPWEAQAWLLPVTISAS